MSESIVWAAGVVASPAAKWIGAEHDRAGPDQGRAGSRGARACRDFRGRRHRGAARGPFPAWRRPPSKWAAMSAELIRARVEGGAAAEPFVYRHAGDLATIGRKAAVVKLARHRAHRLHRLAVLERRAYLFPDRHPQPLRGRAHVAVELPHLPARRAADHGALGRSANFRHSTK